MKIQYLVVLATLVFLGISVPAAAHECERHTKPDHKHCGGGNDPGAEIAVAATFNCPDISAGRNCTSSLNLDRVQGDIPLLSYINGAQDVTAHIRESGILQLRTDAKGEKPGERNIYWDFGSGLILNSGIVLTTTDDLPVGYGHASVIQVGRGAGGLDFRTQGINTSTDTNLWANLIIKPNKGAKEFVFVRFEDPATGDQCPDGSTATPITVTRLSATSWEIGGGDFATACIQGAGLDFILGPFSFVVQEL